MFSPLAHALAQGLLPPHERQAEGPALAVPSHSPVTSSSVSAWPWECPSVSQLPFPHLEVKLDENWKPFSIKAQCRQAVVRRCQLLTFQRQSFPDPRGDEGQEVRVPVLVDGQPSAE